MDTKKEFMAAVKFGGKQAEENLREIEKILLGSVLT